MKCVQEVYQRLEISNFMKISLSFLQLLHLDGRREMIEQKYRLLSFHFRTHPNRHTVNIY
jgi:hypothetical protein